MKYIPSPPVRHWIEEEEDMIYDEDGRRMVYYWVFIGSYRVAYTDSYAGYLLMSPLYE